MCVCVCASACVRVLQWLTCGWESECFGPFLECQKWVTACSGWKLLRLSTLLSLSSRIFIIFLAWNNFSFTQRKMWPCRCLCYHLKMSKKHIFLQTHTHISFTMEEYSEAGVIQKILACPTNARSLTGRGFGKGHTHYPKMYLQHKHPRVLCSHRL